MTLRLHLRDGADDGFTLIEAVAALMVAALIFFALAAAAIAGVRASLTSRQNQQATDFMTRALEEARTMDFGALGHSAADLAGDTRLTTCGGSSCINPGTGASEQLVVLASGAGVVPHRKTALLTSANGTTFSIESYVTAPAGQDVSLVRRVTVFVTWATYGQSHTRTTSSLVAYVQRGLPLPSFKLTPVGDSTETVNPGATAVFGAKLTNQGATDRWNLTVAASQTWTLIRDDGDGVYDATIDTAPMGDVNADGIPDSDVVLPSASVSIWLVRTADLAEPLATSTVTLTAKSIAQPTAAGATASLPFTYSVVAGAVTSTSTPTVSPSPSGPTDCAAASPGTYSPGANSYTGYEWKLHNLAVPANSTAQGDLLMNDAAAYASTLYQYSTDLNTFTGRTLQPTTDGALADTDAKKYVQWRRQITAPLTGNDDDFRGPGRLRLWVAGATGTAVSLRLSVFSETSTVKTLRSSITWTTTMACSGWQEIYLDTPSVNFGIARNDYLGVRVQNIASTDVRIAYDVLGTYPASFTLGVK